MQPYRKSLSKGPIEERTAEDDDIPVLNNFDNIAVDEISAEEIPEPRSAESLESAPEPGKYPYLQSKCYKFAFLQSRTSLSKVAVFLSFWTGFAVKSWTISLAGDSLEPSQICVL